MSLPFACAIAMEKHGLRLKAEWKIPQTQLLEALADQNLAEWFSIIVWFISQKSALGCSHTVLRCFKMFGCILRWIYQASNSHAPMKFTGPWNRCGGHLSGILAAQKGDRPQPPGPPGPWKKTWLLKNRNWMITYDNHHGYESLYIIMNFMVITYPAIYVCIHIEQWPEPCRLGAGLLRRRRVHRMQVETLKAR